MRQTELVLRGLKGNVEKYGYHSACGKHVLKRDEGGRGAWVYRRDGKEIDRDRYRADIAERYGLELQGD